MQIFCSSMASVDAKIQFWLGLLKPELLASAGKGNGSFDLSSSSTATTSSSNGKAPASFADMYTYLVHHPAAWKAVMNTEWAFAQSAQIDDDDQLASSSSSSELTAGRQQSVLQRQQQQQTEFAAFISNIYDNYSGNDYKSQSKLKRSETNQANELWRVHASPSPPKLLTDAVTSADKECACAMPTTPRETSFTVHIGSQLKRMHNIRVMQTDAFKQFCAREQHEGPHDPVRMHTCMNLYGRQLMGTLFLVHNWNFDSNPWRRFDRAEQRWPELHFSSFRDQISQAMRLRGDQLDSGDVLLTRHSNLRETHVVFHIILAPKHWQSLYDSDISSRHNAILAIRNVVKLCWDYDIFTINIPLLLMESFPLDLFTDPDAAPLDTNNATGEEDALQWSLRRAELVLKCLKGFMIEMATLSVGHEGRTVQLLLPSNTPERIFNSIVQLIPSVFTVTTPITL